MNTENELTGANTKNPVKDIGFRLVLIPAFGIAIPLVTRMINEQNFGHWPIKLSFLYTIMIALVIWQGNRYLHFSLHSYFDWINKPVQKITVLLLTVLFYTIPVSVILLIGWYKLFTDEPVNWQIITESTLIILIAVLFITHIYETVFLVKQSQTEMIKNEQLERAKAEAELEALKNQIDPHFIFNSLNTLSHLIEAHPSKAKQFNDNLADVYRYILQNKARGLVLLRDEIDFLNNYFSLLQIRFDKAVSLNIIIDEKAPDQYLIPPISLQVMAENAIKHNEFSETSPLLLEIKMNSSGLIVQNSIRVKKLRKASSKIGLHNLNERYKLTTGKEITVNEGEIFFIVTLPVLKIE